MEESIRKLNKKRAGESDSEEERAKKKAKGKISYLEAEMAKYKTRTVERDRDGKKKRKDEYDIMAALDTFKSQLQRQKQEPATEEIGEGDEGMSSCAHYVPQSLTTLQITRKRAWKLTMIEVGCLMSFISQRIIMLKSNERKEIMKS